LQSERERETATAPHDQSSHGAPHGPKHSKPEIARGHHKNTGL